MKIIKRTDDELIEEREFTTLKELLDVRFVNEFAKKESFDRFSYHELPENKAFLMSEQAKGRACWIVGTISDFNNKDLNLPEWHRMKI